MRATRRTQRQKSNIFEMITQQQIYELREAFNLFDTNSDSFVTRQDLNTILPSIGNPLAKEELDLMLNDAENLNFMAFLTMIGEKLAMTDDEKVLIKAFSEFREGGKVKAELVRHWLMNEGDRMTEMEVDMFFKGMTTDDGEINVDALVSVIKHGEVITSSVVKEE